MLKSLQRLIKLENSTLKHKISANSYENRTYLTLSLKQTLNQLFKSQKNIVTLSKTFRIFLSYFHNDYVDKMLQSEFMDEYLDYIYKKEHVQNSKSKELNEMLSLVDLENEQSQKILEVYINFVKRTVDLTENEILMEIFDIRNPENWFRSTLMNSRKIIFHHGPTNSGKTYSAINELKNLSPNQRGIYMAPLRLLAWEAQQKLGKCNLITGQEKDFQNSHLTSCTIEASKLNEYFDVAIIDEIQMIGDEERGWAWTTPILAIKAGKIHLCGDERALGLVSQLIDKSGGTLEERKYVRLSKLKFKKKDFEYSDIEPGDCIIDFSAQKLYEHRNKINALKGTQEEPGKTAIIYGKMPPTSRKIQAEKFNSGELPYLVASNAIGMGLNLKIRRIIFMDIYKMSENRKLRMLFDHEIRQIAGRAGRGYGEGYVQCKNGSMKEKVKYALRNVNMSIEENEEESESIGNKERMDDDKKIEKEEVLAEKLRVKNYDNFLKRELTEDEQRIKKAGIFFPITIISRMKLKMERLLDKKLTLTEAIKLITYLSKENKKLYFVVSNKELMENSDKFDHLKLTFHDHYIFSQIPLPKMTKANRERVLSFAEDFKNKGIVRVPQEIIERFKEGYEGYNKLEDVKELEEHYLVLDAYTWLWNHFELYFIENSLASEIKLVICEKITEILDRECRTDKENDGKKRKKKFGYNKMEEKVKYRAKEEGEN